MKKGLYSILTLILLLSLFSCASAPKESLNTEEITPLEEPTIFENEENSQQEETIISADDENNPSEEADETVFEPVENEEGIFISEETFSNENEQKDELPELEIEEVPLIVQVEDEKSDRSKAEAQTDKSIKETDSQKEEKIKETSITPGVNNANSTEKKAVPQKEAKEKASTEEITISVNEETSSVNELEGTEASDSGINEEVTEQKEIIPSREVTLKNNQYLDVVYPGSGWVYLGETDGGSKIRYFGRKLGNSDTSFSLRSREEGNTILHFYKTDALTGEYIDDYLSVIIKGKATDSTRILAPSYSEVVPPQVKRESTSKINQNSKDREISDTDENSSSSKKSEKKVSKVSEDSNSSSATSKQSGGSTIIQNSSAAEKTAKKTESNTQANSSQKTNVSQKDTADLSSDEILTLAEECYKKAKYEDCLAYLDAFFEKTATKMDEGLYLKAQTLETNSSVRNIKKALETYETIVNDYPQSINWSKAKERVTYLKRFYFNIR